MWLTNFLSEIRSLSNHDDETQFRILSVKPFRGFSSSEHWWSLTALYWVVMDEKQSEWPIFTWHVYLHLSSTCMATQGGAVSQFLWLFSPFLQDNKERLYFFRFCFVETSGQRDFKQLPNDSLRSICPWIMVLWLQVFVLWQLVRWKWQESVLSDCAFQASWVLVEEFIDAFIPIYWIKSNINLVGKQIWAWNRLEVSVPLNIDDRSLLFTE